MKKRKSGESFCAIPPDRKKRKIGNQSAFYEHKGELCWKGVPDRPYKVQGDDWSGIMRRVLIGERGETARFHVRYFEIAPGGNSSLEHHRHEHVVICVRGKGLVRYSGKTRKMQYMDVLYTSPDAVHQLSNPFDEPFGFFCIVNARRDRPKVLHE